MKNQALAGGKSSRPVSPTQPSASPVRKHTPSNKAALESARPYLRLAAAALALPGKPRLSEDLMTMLARAGQALAQTDQETLIRQALPEPGTVHLIENRRTGERWELNETGEVTILPPCRERKGGPR